MDFVERRHAQARHGMLGPQVAGPRAGASPVTRSRARPRHASLFEAIHRLDATLDRAACDELARWIRDQYASEFGDVPVGLVARCYLGPPYVDHRLDLFQSIVDHFAPADPMPEPFAQARMLARLDVYEYVEVYASGELCPVRRDGSVC